MATKKSSKTEKPKTERKTERKPRTPSNNPPVTAEEFVTAWNQADSPAEVAETTGLAPSSVAARAASYRKKGIELKTMNKGRAKLDVDALNKIARAALKAA